MSFRLQRLAPLLLAACLTIAILAAPATALADSLSWSRTYVGPADIPADGEDGSIVPVAGNFNGVAFADGVHGWAVGVRVISPTVPGALREALVASTADGGRTWTPMTIPNVNRELFGVNARGAGDVWAVGAGGTIVHFDGSSWATASVNATYTAALRAIAFVDADHGWAVGDGYGAIRTSDGGAHWTIARNPSGTPGYRALTAVNSTSVIAVGDAGKASRLGIEVSFTSLPAPASGSLSGITFVDPEHGWVVGDDAVCRSTSTGGASWAPVNLAPLPDSMQPTQLDLRAIAFSDPSCGLIVSTYQTVWRTIDGGAHWVAERFVDLDKGETPGDIDARGVAFAGSADSPVMVGRSTVLDDKAKARAYLGAWSDRVIPPPTAPSNVTALDGGDPRPRIEVSWRDNSSDEDGFTVERATGASGWSQVATLGADATAWIDSTADWTSVWRYRVRSFRSGLYSAPADSLGIAVDGVAPTTYSNAAGSYIESATIDFLPQDNQGGSGVAKTWYAVDGGPSVEGTRAYVTGVLEDPHFVEFWSQDIAGNTENRERVEFAIVAEVVDTDAPTTISDAVLLYSAPTTITLTATDNAGGTGVAHTYYRLDGVPGDPGVGTSVSVSGEGTHTLQFWSVDAKGNVEETKTAKFMIDTTAPKTSAVGPRGFYADKATIALTAADDGSGVASTMYSIDGAAAVSGSGVTVTGAGSHTLAFWSVDMAGNSEEPTSVTFTILTTPSSKGTPSTPASIKTLTHKSSFTTLGYMKKYSKTYSVKLYFYRYKSGHYVYYKSVTAKSASISGISSFLKYSVTTSVPYSGTWRVRARRVVGSTVRYSSYRTFTAL